MSDWEIVSKEKETVEAIAEVLTLGFAEPPYVYPVRFVETGQTRKVVACNEDELGETIAAGEFPD
jgi:hypothetical protein